MAPVFSYKSSKKCNNPSTTWHTLKENTLHFSVRRCSGKYNFPLIFLIWILFEFFSCWGQVVPGRCISIYLRQIFSNYWKIFIENFNWQIANFLLLYIRYWNSHLFGILYKIMKLNTFLLGRKLILWDETWIQNTSACFASNLYFFKIKEHVNKLLMLA